MGPRVASVQKKDTVSWKFSSNTGLKLKYIVKIKTIVFNLPLHLSTHTPPEKAASV